MSTIFESISRKSGTGKKPAVKYTRIAYDYIGYALIAPFYVFMFIFVVVPLVTNIFMSFTNYNLKSYRFIGLKNYINLLSDEHFLISMKNTFFYTSFTLCLTMVIGLFAAILLNKGIPGIRYFRTGVYLPHIMSMAAVSMIWLWIYEPSQGILNQLLKSFGIPGKQWLFDVKYAMGAMIFMGIWKAIGYNMVIFLAGVQAIPKYLYEAAIVDGAKPYQSFYHITLPMLTPVTFFLFVTGIINNFKVFEQVLIMTNGGPMNATTTIVHQIYTRAFREYQMGYAAAMSVILLLCIVVVTAVNMRFGNQGQDLDVS